jgi:metal-sulfur cluster biosynthetic enzyme
MTDSTELIEALKGVDDPEIGMNIVDLGLIYGIDHDDERGAVHVDLTLTSPGCPLGPEIIREVKRALRAVEDILDVEAELVWSPLWHPSMMSDFAKDELGYDDEFGLGYTFY